MSNRNDIVPPLRVGLISLGCAKNLVDAEVMLGALLQNGVQITNDPTQADAVIVNTCSFIEPAQQESIDAILESARLRDTRRPHQAVIVAGCLPQRFRDELPKLLPEVDAFMGIDQVEQVERVIREAMDRRRQRLQAADPRRGQAASEAGRPAQGQRRPPISARAQTSPSGQPSALLAPPRGGAGSPGNGAPLPAAPLVEVNARPHYIPDYATPRFRLTPRHFAYVKIAEGCNHPCSFCIIPRMRGSHRSRALEDVVAEARRLVEAGVKELNLISQDTTYYGLDLRPRRDGPLASPDQFRAATRRLPAETPTLCTLLRALNALPGEFWIRLLYTHPAHWTDELIETIAQCPKVARYVDLPLQHIHDNLLQRMRRETSRRYIEDLIARLRAGLPGVALRTTFIVGFPGETEACFETLLEFIRRTRFERLGVFPYSQEEGTVAGKMSGQIPERTKQSRCRRAMAEQRKIARAWARSRVGQTLQVLVEGRADEAEEAPADRSSGEHGLICRSAGPAPGATFAGCSVARSEADAPDIDGRVYIRGALRAGQFARVRIIGHTDYDLIAEPA